MSKQELETQLNLRCIRAIGPISFEELRLHFDILLRNKYYAEKETLELYLLTSNTVTSFI